MQRKKAKALAAAKARGELTATTTGAGASGQSLSPGQQLTPWFIHQTTTIEENYEMLDQQVRDYQLTLTVGLSG